MEQADKAERDVDSLPLREYWQVINRQERQAKAQKRAAQKLRDQRRPKCRCKAYPWPHRPGGGLCRYPDPPLECWQRKTEVRLYRRRYTGLRRQLARANGLHPVKDRIQIAYLMSRYVDLAKQLKRENPKIKYRNIEITEEGVTGNWQTAGPLM